MRVPAARLIVPVAAAFALLLAPPRARADEGAEHHHHEMGAEVEGLGAVHFPVTCAPAVQAGFDRAMALLHSFGYEEARLAFQQVAQQDPGCAMARWGEAMSWYHPIWAPPSPADLTAGGTAAAAAAALAPKDPREAAYVAAVNAFYTDAATVDHKTRAGRYRDAMQALATRFPDDTEGQILYALALLGTAPPSDPTLAQQKQAAAILNKLLVTNPRHPGVIHYLIHAFDYPATASLALDAARQYASIAPLSAHARHMPSHIFTRLGLWSESIASNWSSVEAAKAQVERTHPGSTAFDALHAYDYLEYAYLQLGQDAKAREVMATVQATQRVDDAKNFAAAYSLAAVPARYALERRQWKDAAALAQPAVITDWKAYPYGEAIVPFANAVGAARSGDVAAARAAVARIAAVQAQLAAAPPAGPYDWAGQVESMRLAAAGWVAHADKKDDEAVQLLTQAADLEEKVGKHPVTPGALLPAREQLGDLLLEMKRPADALAAYDATLAKAPNRYNALAGAVRAAQAAGDAGRAQEYAGKLRTLCGTGCERHEAPAAATATAAKTNGTSR